MEMEVEREKVKESDGRKKRHGKKRKKVKEGAWEKGNSKKS
jgi:hypothetical protein